jgi:hypothetical protein
VAASQTQFKLHRRVVCGLAWGTGVLMLCNFVVLFLLRQDWPGSGNDPVRDYLGFSAAIVASVSLVLLVTAAKSSGLAYFSIIRMSLRFPVAVAVATTLLAAVVSLFLDRAPSTVVPQRARLVVSGTLSGSSYYAINGSACEYVHKNGVREEVALNKCITKFKYIHRLRDARDLAISALGFLSAMSLREILRQRGKSSERLPKPDSAGS